MITRMKMRGAARESTLERRATCDANRKNRSFCFLVTIVGREFCCGVAMGGGGGGAAPPPGCHHFGVTSYYDVKP